MSFIVRDAAGNEVIIAGMGGGGSANAVTVPGGAAISMGEGIGPGAYKIKCTPEESTPDLTASDVSYDGASSGLAATTVQDAVNEVAGKLAAGQVYSTEEVRIGTWMGKPLYRKVFIGVITALDELISIADASGLNIELMTDARAAISSTDAFTVFPAPYTSSYAFVTVLKETRMLCVKTNNNTFLDRNVYVTIEYIKTTDAAEET